MDDRIHALIGYTMADGSDEKVARRIAAVLEAAGIAVICRPMDPDLDLGGFDGVVLGSAVQAMRWPAAARDCRLFLLEVGTGESAADQEHA